MVILGITPFARQARQWIEDSGMEVTGFVAPHGDISTLDGLPVKKNFDDLTNFKFFCGEIGEEMRELVSSIAEASGMVPCLPIIHPSATVAEQVTLEPGSMICPNATLSPFVTVKRGSIVGNNAYVQVEETIHEFSFKGRSDVR